MHNREYGSAPGPHAPAAPIVERLEPRQLMAASAWDDAAPDAPGDVAPALTEEAPREPHRDRTHRAQRRGRNRGRNRGQPPPDVCATVLPPMAVATSPDGVTGEGPEAPPPGVTCEGPADVP